MKLKLFLVGILLMIISASFLVLAQEPVTKPQETKYGIDFPCIPGGAMPCCGSSLTIVTILGLLMYTRRK